MNSYPRQIQSDTGTLLGTRTSRSHSLVHTLAHTDQKHCIGEKQDEEIWVNLSSCYEKQYSIF